MGRTSIGIAAAVTSLAVAGPAEAAPLSVRDSFRIGNGGTIFCSAQTLATDAALKSMFDAGYSITCRDAALPVGKMYKLSASADADARLAAARASKATCSAPSLRECAGPRTRRDDRLQAQGRRRRLPRLPVPQGQAALRRRRTGRLRQRAAARSSQHRRRPAGEGRDLDRDDRRRRSRGFRPGPGGNARSEPGACRSLSPQQCRKLCRSRRILRGRQRRRAMRRSAGPKRLPTKRCRSRTSAAMPRPMLCSRAPRSWSARTRSSLGACATIAQCTCSTRATPRARIAELDKPFPTAGGEGRRRRRKGPRSTPSPPSA